MPVALVAAVLPDVDLIWFYFVDERAFHHHKYWMHVPFFWLVIALATLPRAKRAKKMGLFAMFFGVIALHMFLDTLTGGIAWAMPFSERLFFFFDVSARHGALDVEFHLSLDLRIRAWDLDRGGFLPLAKGGAHESRSVRPDRPGCHRGSTPLPCRCDA